MNIYEANMFDSRKLNLHLITNALKLDKLYTLITFNRLRAPFNNAYRRILDLPWRCSASGMYATYGIYNLEAIIRKQTFGFIGRLCKSCNTIVQTLENAWIIRIVMAYLV